MALNQFPVPAQSGTSALLAVARFTSATGVDTATTTGTFANILAWQVTFTAPASGNVIITMSAQATVASSMLAWRLADAGVAVAETESPAAYASTGTHQRHVTMTVEVTGLTPSTSYTFTWQHARTVGSSTAATSYGGSNGQALMTVMAAP